LATMGIAVRVVSMPCCERFDRQKSSWKKSVLLPDVPRIAIEAAHPDPWRKYVGLDGEVLGLARFGESAPAPALYERFGLTVAQLTRVVIETVARESGNDGDF
jgi:transketolase